MNTNMTSLDRRLRLLLIAPLAVAIGILIGPGSLGSIALYALAAILLATGPGLLPDLLRVPGSWSPWATAGALTQ